MLQAAKKVTSEKNQSAVFQGNQNIVNINKPFGPFKMAETKVNLSPYLCSASFSSCARLLIS